MQAQVQDPTLCTALPPNPTVGAPRPCGTLRPDNARPEAPCRADRAADSFQEPQRHLRLAAVAQRLQALVRASDSVVRLGGR